MIVDDDNDDYFDDVDDDIGNDYNVNINKSSLSLHPNDNSPLFKR